MKGNVNTLTSACSEAYMKRDSECAERLYTPHFGEWRSCRMISQNTRDTLLLVEKELKKYTDEIMDGLTDAENEWDARDLLKV